MIHLFRRRTGLAIGLVVTNFTWPITAHADWTALALPALRSDFASYQMAHLPDGRLIFGTDGNLDRQTAFQISGPVGLEDYSETVAWFPSSITVFSETLGVIGKGNFGPSQLYTFDPSNLATPFTAIPNVSLQDYSVVFRDANSLYLSGLNGTGGRHAISYVTLSGASQLLIDDVSTFSGAMAIDRDGNLFVSDNDDRSLYKFTATQLADAIAENQILSLDDGIFVTKLSRNASLAVDGMGRIWAAGFQGAGIEMFDPQNGLFTNFVPNLENSNYVVGVFSIGDTDYVGYLNASGFKQGAALTYGFDLVSNLVPEPSSAALLVLGCTVFARRRRH